MLVDGVASEIRGPPEHSAAAAPGIPIAPTGRRTAPHGMTRFLALHIGDLGAAAGTR
jgi:hypothetical protein